jgi:hypothetical protein
MIDDGVSDSLYIVGKSTLGSGLSRAFVYIRKNQEFVDVPTLLGLDENFWIASVCTAISSNGIVVGVVTDVGGVRHLFWFDILASNPNLNLLEDIFPQLLAGTPGDAIDVNSNGEVLTRNGWVLNINDNSLVQLPTEVNSAAAINEFGVVIGWNGSGCYRYNVHTGSLESIIAIDNGTPKDINSLGEFCGHVNVPYRRNSTRNRAYRWGYGSTYDWLSDPALPGYSSGFVIGEALNDSGDVVGQVEEEVFSFNAFLLYSKKDSNGNEIGTTYKISDLVDDPYLNTAGLGFMLVTERDPSLSTPAPIIVGNAGTGSDEKIFILIPEELPPSSTFSSTDTPTPIPDYNPANPQQHASSTINIPDDLTITGMSVNLNINHPQPGSLLVYLYGPDNGPPVQLFNVSGDNNVPVFNGTSSLGNWTLEVYDTVKKKTGTLNSWSITIDH